MSGKRFDLCVRLFLASATLVVYGQVWSHAFLNYDDNQYVTQNPYVLRGLTADGVRWAFTSIHSANWHPLTTLSHLLDVELFGLHAGSHLLLNAVLHAAASIVLYEVLARTTRRRGPSAFTAALFALHPLHVESVAWVAERKDVLSALLGLLAVAAYTAYARRPTAARYGVVVALFALGLLAKPMLVTLPFALLLLDFWPLARVRGTPAAGDAPFTVRPFGRLVAEKVPLLLLAGCVSTVTFLVQRQAGAVVSTATLPLSVRLENAVVAYATYLLGMLWPARLAVFYPLQIPIPAWQVAAAAAVLMAISVAVAVGFRRHPYLLTGWLWYLGLLVPVIGLVRVGDQAMADRYTYLPSIGVSIMVAWGAADLLARWRHRRLGLGAAATMVLVGCAVITRVQVGHWRDTDTLFGHALAVTEGNYIAHTNLGAALMERDRAAEALVHFEAAVRARPDHAQARINIGIARGIVLAQRGDAEAAEAQYAGVLRADPSNAMAHFNWGVLRAQQGDADGAVEHYREALRLAPGYAKADNNLGLVLARQQRWPEAIAHYRSAIASAPYLAEAYGNLGIALEATGDGPGALAAYRDLVSRRPDEPKARYNLAALLAQQGRTEESAQQYREALRLQPGWPPAEQGLAEVLGAGARPPNADGR